MCRISVFVLLLFTGCSTPPKEPVTTPDKPQYFVYAPNYSVDFTLQRPEYAATVLKIWKGYESGSFTSYADYFTDTVQFLFEDRMLIGNKQDLLKQWNERRRHISTIQCHIGFWHSAFVKEKGEYWVFIWASHEGTTGETSRDSWNVHQVWRFNQQNKIYYIQEYKSRFSLE
jgi:hypothetical protein